MKAVFVAILLSTVCLGFSQTVEPISLENLRDEMTASNDELRVYNFWASWCGPCIKEMPYFDELSNDTNVTLVSVDFEEDLQKAKNILVKKKINLSSYLLAEKDTDKYVSVISESWSGAIPATVIITPAGDRYFFERSFEKEDLFDLINSLK